MVEDKAKKRRIFRSKAEILKILQEQAQSGQNVKVYAPSRFGRPAAVSPSNASDKVGIRLAMETDRNENGNKYAPNTSYYLPNSQYTVDVDENGHVKDTVHFNGQTFSWDTVRTVPKKR